MDDRSSDNRFRWTIFILCLLATSFAGMVVDAQVQNAVPAGPAENDERARRMEEMQRRILAIDVLQDAADVRIVDKPLLRFDDPARGFHDGTIWAFGTTGRPAALGTLERYESFWSYELIALSDSTITAKSADGVVWSPRAPSLEWIHLTDVPAAADSGVRRMIHMRQLMRRLTLSSQLASGDRFELRLMPTHIHRYSDPDTHITDGAIFVFAYGRNPEAIAVVECREDDSGQPQWFISFAPLSTAALGAKLDDRDIWTKPYVPPSARTIRDTYLNFSRS